MTENASENTAESPESAGAPGVRDVFSPATIAPDALARMLGLPVEVVRRHIDEGAPVNPDGTVNLVHYAAWLNAPAKEDADVGARND
ncbi:MAG: hypothetical protein GC159_20950 [Phycisphaera sp.]|nr:hypothetical protein [Phycisphaera sp.]